jgi:hypothetical protein
MMTVDDVVAEDRDWLRAKMAEAEGDDPYKWECQDNFRLAAEGDPASEAAFEDAERGGCCGSATFRFAGSPSGAAYVWGFNYGH